MTKATAANTQVQTQATATKMGRTIDPNSKQSKGRALFQELNSKGTRRCDVIRALVKEVGLTANGAATYYQNFKKEAGLVKSAPVAQPEA
jgi:hypothetical protein